MTKLETQIRPELLTDLQTVLSRADVIDITVADVCTRIRRPGSRRRYLSMEYMEWMQRRLKIEVLVADPEAGWLARALAEFACRDGGAFGRVLVTRVGGCVTARADERVPASRKAAPPVLSLVPCG